MKLDEIGCLIGIKTGDLMLSYIDSMDGPVVQAAEEALEIENVNYILPFVARENEEELKDAFEKTISVRELSGEAAELADYWFFETAVRLHKKSQNEPYNGLKPAGKDFGPIISKLETAIETESIKEFLDFLMNFIREDIESGFDDVIFKKDYDINQVEDARDYINSMLEFVEYTQKLYKYVEKG